MKPLFIFVSFLAVFSLLLNAKLLYDRQIFQKPTFKVFEVIDGDTFKINEGRGV